MILHFSELGSTNDWLKAQASQLPDGQWVRADRQTAGRGRQQRPWRDVAGNLAASCLVRLRPGDVRATDLCFVMALAVHATIADLVGEERLHIKWPNDVLLDGGKVSGILLERQGAAVIIGVGVNLNHAPQLPGQKTADLGGLVAPDAFCERLAAAFQARLALWRAEGFAAIRNLWLTVAHPVGAKLRTTVGSVKEEGRFAGLTADGALLLETADGRLLTIHSGDVWED